MQIQLSNHSFIWLQNNNNGCYNKSINDSLANAEVWKSPIHHNHVNEINQKANFLIRR